MKDIVVESVEYYKKELEKIKENELNKTINDCIKTIDIFAKILIIIA